MYRYYNRNPKNRDIEDCVIRSLSLLTNRSWENVYKELTHFSSKDGYIMVYTLPSFDLIRSIYIPSLFKDESEFLYADNVFLSNSPLPSITVYISKKRLFKTFTINGHFIQDIKEEEGVNSIKSPIVFESFDYQDYLIYGTNNGLIKIRKFPEMELANSIKPFNNDKSIECICLSLDQKYCFAWSSSNEIAVISNCFTK